MERAPVTAEVELKRCYRCHQHKPLSEFRRMYSGSEKRQPDCNGCHNFERRLRRRRQRHHDAYQFAAKASKKTMDRAVIAGLIRAMITRFNGLEQFADDWHSAIQAAGEAGRHKSVLNSMLAIINLMAAIEQTDDTPVGEMSDEDLEAMVSDGLMHLAESGFDCSAIGS